jgi:hypothetical protein
MEKYNICLRTYIIVNVKNFMQLIVGMNYLRSGIAKSSFVGMLVLIYVRIRLRSLAVFDKGEYVMRITIVS